MLKPRLPASEFEVLPRPPGSESVAFSESEIGKAALESVSDSLLAIRVRCPQENTAASGTGVLVGFAEGTRVGIVATAAHVVEHRDRQPWPEIAVRPERTSDFLPADLLAATGYRQGEQDVALLAVSALPEQATACPMLHQPQREHLILRPGARVAYAGYPFGLSPTGACDVMFARGMVAGVRPREHPDDASFLEYVIDGMVSAGMSGGPVFCPDTGAIAALITRTVTPAHVSGHGWAHAIPADEIVRLWIWTADQIGMEVKGYQPRDQ